jgi:hypothetical protein
LAFTLAGSTAQAAWMAPSGGWQLNYEASGGDLPEAASPAWTNSGYQSGNSGADNYVTILADGVTSEQALYLGNTATSGQKWPIYDLTSGAGAGTASDKITLDFRFRLIDVPAGWQWGLAVNRPAAGGDRSYLFDFGTTGILNGNTFSFHGVSLGNDWHDARVLIDVAANTADLYLDGSATAEYSITGTFTSGGTNNDVWFGDGQGAVEGKVHLSYLRLTNNELASVVPEPASLGLLALGGATMLMRRRRQA